MRTLKWKNRSLVVFDTNASGELTSAVIIKDNIAYLPLPITWCLKDEALIHTEYEDFYLLNDEGLYYVENWFSNREIPINRKNIKKYVEHHSPREWMLNNNAFSFTDCYWVADESENITWEDICKKKEDLDLYRTVHGSKTYQGLNSTLGGELEKFWYKENNALMLCKKTNINMEILSLREVFANMVLKKQGFKNYCHYDLIQNTHNEIVGCCCKAFTDENTELITANDLLEEFHQSQNDNVFELIISYAAEKGLNESDVRNYLETMTVMDFLIGNRDRHLGNIGFLRDTKTLKLISCAPIYDSGSSEFLEGEKPEAGLNTKVNSFEASYGGCLSHVTNLSVFDLNRLPSREELMQLLDKAKNITAHRKAQIADDYIERINTLKVLIEQRDNIVSCEEDLTISDDSTLGFEI